MTNVFYRDVQMSSTSSLDYNLIIRSNRYASGKPIAGLITYSGLTISNVS